MAFDLGTQAQVDLTRNVNDLNSTHQLRQHARTGSDEALREVAQQFESIFVRMLLKTMRQAQDTLSDKDNPLNSDQMKFYRDMHDQQLAVNLSSNGSLGLADIIVQQLKGPISTSHSPAMKMHIASQATAVTIPYSQHATSPATDHTVAQAADQETVQGKQAVFETPEAFVDYILPKVKNAAEQIGLDPKALVAQAALETGWGKFVMHDQHGKSAHNLFGIKADGRWGGDKVIVNTMENSGGITSQVKAAFRRYESFAESISDYVDFLKSNTRYGDALNQTNDAKGFFRALQDAGYATDPNYADKIMSIYQGDKLNRSQR